MKKISVFQIAILITTIFIFMLPNLNNKNLQAKNGSKLKDKPKNDDMGKKPFVLDIEKATMENTSFRHVKWTGAHLQMVLMNVKPGEEIDLEMHPAVDQFLRIEQGQAQILMGKTKQDLSFNKTVSDDWAILIPAGYYHNVKNTGKTDLKLYSIYAPANHPAGTIHKTHQDAKKAHEKH
ncbi:cupin domain-containing protein [Adhaeribacter terreus]|uniref:Cupin domain-containing protein n=1 Tax=Adhaeribacter terreus TaxID=529703 RepID=A0ABW0E6P9_9BACT